MRAPRSSIFELASASGGSTALSSAEIYMGGNGGTRVQRACGFEDSTEDMVTYMMMCAGPQADEAKIRNYCEHSREHFQWLVGSRRALQGQLPQGAGHHVPHRRLPALHRQREGLALCQQAKPCPRGHNLQVEGDNGGPLFMKIVTGNVEKRGVRSPSSTKRAP